MYTLSAPAPHPAPRLGDVEQSLSGLVPTATNKMPPLFTIGRHNLPVTAQFSSNGPIYK